MIDFTKLTDKELLQYQEDINTYIQNKIIPEPDFHLRNSIQIKNISNINQDTLIPTLEFKISVNKEDLQDFRVFWENYYNKKKQFYGYHKSLSPEDQVTLDIRHEIERVFGDHLDEVFPIGHRV